MGLDFIRRAAPSFTKSWNRGARELADPSLFTRLPECRTRTVVATLNDGVNVPAGTQLAARLHKSKLLLIRETTPVGHVDAPPADVVRVIQDAGGCAVASIARIKPLSGTADVEIE
jgi:hypothetical protein